MDSAVIFDVDGVLLELTSAEEDIFFQPFAERYGLAGLSRDWDGYRVRNDEDIIGEILEVHGLPAAHKREVIGRYLATMRDALAGGLVAAVEIPGARGLLEQLAPRRQLGIATANLAAIARLRLQSLGLWDHVGRYPFGAEGGGHKRKTLARAIAATGLPRERIVYIGDNLNDADAGLGNGVHFIGFAVEENRRVKLSAAGARHLSGDHATTLALIGELLGP